MNTEKIYQKNAYLRESHGIITSVFTRDSKKILTLDRTLFFPTGGGQSCDIGTLINTTSKETVNVLEVYEKDDEIYHVVDDVNDIMKPGLDVSMIIDWPRRFDNMQRHCGEHILSGAFYRLYGGANKGFHMGDDYITVDIAFPKDSEFQRVTWEMAEAVEFESNKVIWSDAPVVVNYFENRCEAEKMPLRKALAFDNDISIVTIGDNEKPMDCVACCGTHPSTAGQVGLIKIYKIEPNKGMSRVFFESGGRALENYRSQFNVLYDLGNKLSAGFEDISSKYDTQVEKNQEVRDRLHRLSGYIVDSETDKLISEIAASSAMIVKEYDMLTSDDILNIGKGISDSANYPVALIDANNCTLFLFSNGQSPCGKIIKDGAPLFGGRGGGKDSMARAAFPDMKSLRGFLETL
jgi:alanyl-tRNA synthetase